MKIERERGAKKELETDNNYRKFQNKLSENAELLLQNKIKQILDGKPGLLIRSVESKAKTYEVLSELIGKEIVPNCRCKEDGEHKPQCYDLEADLILFFPANGKLQIRLIEVKRPDGVPWAEEMKASLNKLLVNKALNQLEKDTKFILDLLPDIPTEKLDIKAVMAFPETECEQYFCESCINMVITAEDMKNDSQILKKLSVKPEEMNNVPEDNNFLKACARFLGKASLLHDGFRKVSDKDEKGKAFMKRHEQAIEENRCVKLLSSEEREALYQVSTSNRKNFAFSGSSGSGKTCLGLLSVSKLVNFYSEEYNVVQDDEEPIKNIQDKNEEEAIDQEPQTVHVYISIHRFPYYKKYPELLKIFENSPILQDIKEKENVKLNILPEDSLVNDIFEWDSKEKQEVNNMKIGEKLLLMLVKLDQRHKKDPVIVFFDEISAPDGDKRRKLDLSNLSSPRPDIHFILSLSPVCDVGKPWSIEDKFLLPTDNKFLHVPLSLRYRSTRNLQKFTDHVGTFNHNFLISPTKTQGDVPFSSGSVLEGELPEWTDVGSDERKIYGTLKRLKKEKLGENDEVTLLWHFEQNGELNALNKEGFLDYITKPRREGGFGWKMVDYGL